MKYAIHMPLPQLRRLWIAVFQELIISLGVGKQGAGAVGKYWSIEAPAIPTNAKKPDICRTRRFANSRH